MKVRVQFTVTVSPEQVSLIEAYYEGAVTGREAVNEFFETLGLDNGNGVLNGLDEEA